MTRSTFDVDAWLGPFAEETSDEHKAAITAASDAISARYPDEDDADDREEALAAAAQIVLGDTILEEIGRQFVDARAVAHRRQVALTGALIASEGTEVSLAERARVTRMTVRKALGKA